MGDLGPEPILRFEFTPGIEIGFLPQQAQWGARSLMKMGFLPKQGTSFLPYNLEMLEVIGESPPRTAPTKAEEEPVPTPSPPAGAAPVATAPTASPATTSTPPATTTTTTTPPATTPPATTPPVLVAPVSGLIRPHNPQLSLVSRISPRAYLKSGIAVRLYLDGPGHVSARVTSNFKMGAGKAKEHTISKTASRNLASGHYEITLRPDSAAKLALQRHRSLEAEVILSFLYSDKTSGEVKKSFMIAPAS